jgi:hypothetical protein
MLGHSDCEALMAGIPSAMDHKMAEIDDLAASIVIALRTMRHTPGYERQLRERLQLFADTVIETANTILAGR